MEVAALTEPVRTALDANVWIALGAVVLTGLGYAVTATLYVARVQMDSRARVDEAKADAMKDLNNSKELMLAVIERELSKEQKSRHDLASHIQLQIADIDKDFRIMTDRVIAMVHKEDLNATERRITAQIEKLEKRIELDSKGRNG